MEQENNEMKEQEQACEETQEKSEKKTEEKSKEHLDEKEHDKKKHKHEHEIEELKKKLAEKEKEVKENKDKMLRAYAEMENNKRRMRMEAQEAVNFGVEKLIRDILPVIDNFERSLASAKQTQNVEKLEEGVQLTIKQLQSALEKVGLKEIEAKPGAAFDPQIHEAVMSVPATEEYSENMIAELLQKGYTLKDRVIRAAMVKVAKE